MSINLLSVKRDNITYYYIFSVNIRNPLDTRDMVSNITFFL